MTNQAINHYYRQAKFLISAAAPKQFPKGESIEVAFVGRSNAGKSSSINTLCDNKGLAKISKTPGRTRLVNYFEMDEKRRLVDLPASKECAGARPVRAGQPGNMIVIHNLGFVMFGNYRVQRSIADAGIR